MHPARAVGQSGADEEVCARDPVQELADVIRRRRWWHGEHPALAEQFGSGLSDDLSGGGIVDHCWRVLAVGDPERAAALLGNLDEQIVDPALDNVEVAWGEDPKRPF